MKTASLLAALNIAKHSLGSNDSVYPVLASFCFMEDIVYAYNDITAIVVEEQTGLNCALHGDTLLGVLGVAGTEDITVTINGGAAELKLKSGKVKVPCMDEKMFLFTPPDETPILSVPFTAEIAQAIECCLLCVSVDNVRQEFNGVTLRISPQQIAFYSSDNKSAMRVIPSGKFMSRKSASVVIPTIACEQMLKLRKDGARFSIGEKFGTFEIDGVTLFTKLLPANTDVFDSVFQSHAAVPATAAIPAELARELSKAEVLLGREAVKYCTLRFAPASVSIEAAGVLGSMNAVIAGDKTWNAQMKGAVITEPAIILRVLKHAKFIAVNDNASLCFENGAGFTYIASSKGYYKPNEAPRQQEAETLPKAPIPKANKPGFFDNLEDDIPF